MSAFSQAAYPCSRQKPGTKVQKEVKEMAEQTNKYETIFVLDADLDEETTNGLVEKVKWLIASNGTVVQVDVWGKRRLAYPINYKNEGYYVLIEFTSNPSFPSELERIYNITENVMRSIVVKKEA